MVEVIQAFLATITILFSAAGYGHGLLKNLKEDHQEGHWLWVDRIAIGTGFIGFLTTIVSIYSLSLWIIWTILLGGTLLLLNLKSYKHFLKSCETGIAHLSSWKLGFVLTLIFLMVVIFSGMAPTTDADTLAYHLNLPMLWKDAGKLINIQRLEAFAPLNVHMLHTVSLMIGGERCVTLLNSMGHFVMFLCMVRLGMKYNSKNCFDWIFLAGLAMAAAPVVLLGLGSGKVEYWLTAWTICGFNNLIRYIETTENNYAWRTGCFLGLCVGSKYYGLISVISFGCVLCMFLLLSGKKIEWNKIRGITLIAFGAFLLGSFWYFRNYILLGNPLFPAFKTIFPTTILNSNHEMLLNDMMQLKKPFMKNIIGFVYSLVSVSFIGPAMLGPLVVILSLGVFIKNSAIKHINYVRIFAIIFVSVWFLMAFQRSRHLVPMLAILVPIGAVCWNAAIRECRWMNKLSKGLLLGGVIFELGIGTVIASQSALTAIGLETAEELRARTIPGYKCVAWVNENLNPNDKVLFDRRTHSALIHVNAEQISFFSLGFNVSNVNSSEDLIHELGKNGITHVLLVPLPQESWDGSNSPLRKDYKSEVIYFESKFRWILFNFLKERGELVYQHTDQVSQGGRLFGIEGTNDVRVYRVSATSTVSPNLQ